VVNRIVFIRSAETTWNRDRRWQGWVDSPLNDHGRQQAYKLANYVRHLGLGEIYTSDLRRATETAQAIAIALGLTPIQDVRLRERSVGIWQGLTQEEMADWYPAEYAQYQADRENAKVSGAESRAELRARATDAIHDIIAKANSDTIAIISHTTAIRVILDDLIPDRDVFLLDFANTSVTTIRRKSSGEGWELVAVDDLSHLEGLESRFARGLEDKR
jgi:glucosyl-3-phosphoglycerate phosphatase